jgi:hypothetical protein
LKAAFAALCCSATLLTGCGADVELNGAIFDVMGVSGTSARRGDPKIPNRAGLVVPPSTNKLPPPGTAPAQSAHADPSWPVDPEERQVAAAAAQRKAHDEFCKKALLRAKVDNPEGDVVMGPLGRCESSILDMLNVNTTQPGASGQ